MSRGNGHTTDSKRFFDWIFYAYQDLLSAKTLIEDKRLYEPAVFHCQQAIEKALKGYMLFKTHKLYDGHNVTWLCKQAALIDSSFTEWIPKTSELNRLYIETRYPADIHFNIEAAFAFDNVELADKIMDHVCEVIKFDYNSYHKRLKKK